MQSRTPFVAASRTQRRRLSAWGALAVTAGLVLSGCSSSPTAPADSSETSEPAEAVAIPQTTAGLQIQWMLDLLNADADIAANDFDGKFTMSFTEEAPAETVAEQMNVGVRPDKPFLVTGYQDVSDVLGAARITGASGQTLSLEMRVEDDGTIAEMLVRPAPKQ